MHRPRPTAPHGACTDPGLPHPTGHAPTQAYRAPRGMHRPRPTAPHGACTDSACTLHCHRHKITHVICLVLYHLHTRPPTLCKTRSRSPLPTLIICSILYHIYIASLLKVVSNLMMATAAMAETCS